MKVKKTVQKLYFAKIKSEFNLNYVTRYINVFLSKWCKAFHKQAFSYGYIAAFLNLAANHCSLSLMCLISPMGDI